MKTYSSKAERIAVTRMLLAGVEKHLTRNIVLNGKSVSAKDIATLLNGVLKLDDKCNDLRAQLSAAVKAAAKANEEAVMVVAALKSYLIAHYGASSPVLADFGFSPRKTALKTVAEKYQAVAKQLATRAARHTMGLRQKASIHGSTPSAPAVAASSSQPVASSNGALSAVVQVPSDTH